MGFPARTTDRSGKNTKGAEDFSLCRELGSCQAKQSLFTCSRVLLAVFNWIYFPLPIAVLPAARNDCRLLLQRAELKENTQS